MNKRKSRQVRVGNVKIGGNAPIVVQSMTNTKTQNVHETVNQIIELAEAGSELVRFTVENDAMAKAVPEIRKELEKKGFGVVPLIGDFHYNGHLLLNKFPECAETLDKLRINPGNTGPGQTFDPNFKAFIDIAVKFEKPVRIGVNWGSLNQDLLKQLMDENQKSKHPKPTEEIVLDTIAKSALDSAQKAIELGLDANKIILSAKASRVQDFIKVNKMIAEQCDFALHVGITEGGFASEGIIKNAVGTGLLLQEGIGDTIRYSLTLPPGSPRSLEVTYCQQLLQALEIRNFFPSVTSCPGCGRTTPELHQSIAKEISEFVREKTPDWKRQGFKGFEKMHVSVMGCIVNGPGEACEANIGLCLPGSGEDPVALVIADQKQIAHLKGEDKAEQFKQLIDKYVREHYSK